MNLEGIMLHEITHSQKNKTVYDSTYEVLKLVTFRDSKWNSCCQIVEEARNWGYHLMGTVSVVQDEKNSRDRW